MDSIFLEDISKILDNHSKRTLIERIDGLIVFSAIKCSRQIDSNIFAQKDSDKSKTTTWIQNNIFLSKKTKLDLLKLLRCDTTRRSYYVEYDDSRNPKFINEPKYLLPFPNVETRLLSLARLWNAVYYFYPYYELIESEWENIFDQSISNLIKCRTSQDYHLEILRIAVKLRDGHGSVTSNIIEKYYGYYSLPLRVTYIKTDLFITGLLNKGINSSFQFGDIIKEINGQRFNDFYKKDSIFIHGSNINMMKTHSGNNFIKCPDSLPVNVLINRDNKDTLLLIKPKNTSNLTQIGFRQYIPKADFVVGQKFIYINLNKIDSISFTTILSNNRKPFIIIDLREYPNWILNPLSELFVKSPIEFANYSYPVTNQPGQISKPIKVFVEGNSLNNVINYDKIFLLVNQFTISRGEFVCMAFQCLPNVITVGDFTAGADGDVSLINLPGNITIRFSGLKICYPDNSQTQQKGVKINEIYHINGQSVIRQFDEHLQFVLQRYCK